MQQVFEVLPEPYFASGYNFWLGEVLLFLKVFELMGNGHMGLTFVVRLEHRLNHAFDVFHGR
uniref:Uncharacterized protein n=1 Tax=Lepeophtheirus salmonis TaxID=72036 RepID=A0A0K2VCM2_LEPSM